MTQFMRPIGVQGLDMGVPLPDPTELPWPELVWAHRRRGPELQAASGPAPTGPHSPARADTAPWRPRASSRPQPVTRPGGARTPQARGAAGLGVHARTPPRSPLARWPLEAPFPLWVSVPATPGLWPLGHLLELLAPRFPPPRVSRPCFSSMGPGPIGQSEVPGRGSAGQIAPTGGREKPVSSLRLGVSGCPPPGRPRTPLGAGRPSQSAGGRGVLQPPGL